MLSKVLTRVLTEFFKSGWMQSRKSRPPTLERSRCYEVMPHTSCTHMRWANVPTAVLQKLPDLARGLARIQYGRCGLRELHTFLKAFNKVATSFPTFTSSSSSEVGFRSPLLNRIIWALPKLRMPVQALVSQINMTQLELDKKADIWTNMERWPNIEDSAEVRIQTPRSNGAEANICYSSKK